MLDDIDLIDSTKASKSPLQLAKAEYNHYLTYMKSCHLPVMKASKVLGAFNVDGDPREKPVYSIGAVVERGADLPSGHNHAEYVDPSGHYDIVQYLEHR